MKLSVLIPVLLDDRVFSTIYLLDDYLNQKFIEHEFVVSGTLSEPKRLPPNVIFISTDGQKGSNLIRGLRACKGETILFIDADLPASCEDILKLVLKSNVFDVVLGYRIFNTPKKSKKIPLLRKLRTTIFKSYVNLLFPSLQKYDTQYGLKVFKAKALRKLLNSKASHYGLVFDLELCVKISQSSFSVFHMKIPYAHADKSVINPVLSTLELVFNALCIRLSILADSGMQKQRKIKQLNTNL
jgi:glycosyltransferase involved in cell wall biosynthesis